jgi:hypothetical protein
LSLATAPSSAVQQQDAVVAKVRTTLTIDEDVRK